MSSVNTEPTPADRGGRSPLFSALVGVTALAVLLQGLWAGIFLAHDGRRDQASGWIDVHGWGANVALLFALASTVVAFVQLRPRRDLWLGSLVLTLLLVVESVLGGLIGDKHDWLTAVHIPLAMALMALVVWLPMRARRGR